ncbi:MULTISPECIES: ImmA/IrrE family metallo-endopeptidase [Bacilli]|uniref:ImmA/IrrE family metallo-endopeptidase n=1 Tax=Bacilli TaxID=91061 RepID=UPI001D823430|nr:ImmA/IrrE family metallo-endopeptidase [Staphylococcus ureilyticus]HJG66642.1 ImmA/IrrE family metallo-endopeptidase [Staphylococcus ureilyticus]
MFDGYIRKISSELNVKIAYLDLTEDDAHYLPTLDIIVVNQNLSEFEQQKAIIHELAHAALHKNEHKLYMVTSRMHKRMETEAENCLIEQLVYHYKEYTEPENANWLDFMERYDVEPEHEFIVKEVMTSAYYGSEQFISFVD